MTKIETVTRFNKIISNKNHLVILRDLYVVEAFELDNGHIYAIVDGDVNDEPIRSIKNEIKVYPKTEVTWHKIKGCQ